MVLSIGFRSSASFPPAMQATGLLTLTPAGLPPPEHTSLSWTRDAARPSPRWGLLFGRRRGAAEGCGCLSKAPHDLWSNGFRLAMLPVSARAIFAPARAGASARTH